MADLPAKPAKGAYEPKPVLRNAATGALQASGFGVLIGVTRLLLSMRRPGVGTILSHIGSSAGTLAAITATYFVVEASVANHRESDDALSGIAGGCAAGFLGGLRTRSLPVAIGSCAVLGATIGSMEYVGPIASKEEKEEKRKKFFKTTPLPLQGNVSE
ncbi:hypothetical protein F5I97DRAFT_1958374 [Phlebopus sp. FC_14]|nr:hypothetical protein F5I97DRAFT_1958374 [Phlebopus sp. FC_14]